MAPIEDSIRFIKSKNTKGKIEKILGADHRMKKDGELEKAINIAIEYINKRYGALCEDMESIAIYKVANIYKIPAVCIRGISNNEILGQKYDYSVSHKMQKITERLVEVI